MKYALLSVSDKTGITEFAKGLVAKGFKILSTGGTRKALNASNIESIEVSNFTKSPEIFDGRVKTLHPNIAGGILYRRDNEKDLKVASELDIKDIALVCVNLYPFKATTKKTTDLNEIIENIDIGGPSLLRAGAKNYKHVYVVCDFKDYSKVLEALSKDEKEQASLRSKLMLKAFTHTADYDCAIASFMQGQFGSEDLPETLLLSATKAYDLNYGENPHQKAALYTQEVSNDFASSLKALKGNPSFNNIGDINAALKIASYFLDSKIAVIIKHANPCGVSLKNTHLESFKEALKCDSISAYGGVLAINGELSLDLAKEINKGYMEVIVAKSFSQEALDLFNTKKRIKLFTYDFKLPTPRLDIRILQGGVLVQEADYIKDSEIEDARLVSKTSLPKSRFLDLKLAYVIAGLTKSNSIAYVKDASLVAIGMGNTSRVDAAFNAVKKASDMGLDIKGSVMASEAFLPFKDSVEIASKNGVVAIVQPGGSIRDEEVIECANANNIALYFTGVRHFLH
ncbi:bifunctional phosphoribosylaminoimidazolecarboxamide formyltransferase/IMP cyclohydrolase [Helicobacter sp. 13S00401-1]|uniref:bifunctional phosphoribosylaminoimidazolecarboxamide formyltransferase/IMP cyclohydrolase n=1 Tax=Helicobacter sp. 13S00401-1 TaxID=1905758 RepID=UPI000BA4ECF5|nr:bifunctional phosphoribosylaminoimidazolecarboxamide formyltransferase/IMP cyclohydrolase [Helicobacter sp. 13S00401-1]PAF50719.1 bifunctional phosphoribosylaminoimidazolecarboxamide formyltransferase/IMP cyclohydrolase [Helicobacter sp. 13S00401-1]